MCWNRLICSVQVFLVESVSLTGHFDFSFLVVFLRLRKVLHLSCETLRLRRDTKNRHIIFPLVIVNRFKGIKDFISDHAFESVIILLTNMYNEFSISFFQAFRQSLNFTVVDMSLQFILLEVTNPLCCNDKIPWLFHPIFVELPDWTWVNDLLVEA